MSPEEQAREEVAQMTRWMAARGWMPATSGNVSLMLDQTPLRFIITASGGDKSLLTAEQTVAVGEHGESLEDSNKATNPRPSAESIVHAAIYKKVSSGAILHGHTIANNLAAERGFSQRKLLLSNFEMIKGLGIWEEGAIVAVPVVENFYALADLSAAISAAINPPCPGALVHRHGLYAWGKNSFEAKRNFEAFEFIFQFIARLNGQ